MPPDRTGGPGRAQAGLDRLALFLVAVLFVLLVAPTVLGLAGIDVRDERAGKPAEPPRLVALGAEGVVAEGGGSVEAVRVVVANVGGGEVDPTTLTATWVGNGTYTLVADGADAEADGTFTVAPLSDGRERPVLRDAEDRAVVTIDVGTDDVDGARAVGATLRPGETATVTLVTPGGATARADLAVPGTLPTGGSVAL